jgi:hypothetical protein
MIVEKHPPANSARRSQLPQGLGRAVLSAKALATKLALPATLQLPHEREILARFAARGLVAFCWVGSGLLSLFANAHTSRLSDDEIGTNRTNRPLANEAEVAKSRKVVVCEAIQTSENKHGEQQGTANFG